jgi:sirohydrochlorin ferrochelatase
LFQDPIRSRGERALLLVAHGSRRPEPAAELEALAAALAERLGTRVATAYLELTPPSIPEGLRALLAEGHRAIGVIPFFLSSGRHVLEDVPNEVAEVVAEASEARIEILQAVGLHGGMIGLLEAIARGEG